MRLVFGAVSVLVFQAQTAWAQVLTEKIWSVVAFTLYGDTTPTALPQSRTLTPLGAQDLYTAGSIFRDRYVSLFSDGSGVETRVQGISPYLLNADQVDVYSTSDQFVTASAQAFMQGLYPPLGKSYNGTYTNAASSLANGPVVSFPLDGYQYADIYTAGWTDPYSISVSGQANCFTHQMSEFEYQVSAEFLQISEETLGFYAYIYDIALSGVYDAGIASYANAYDIWEYLEYAYLHNTTLQDILPEDNLNYVRALANQYAFATNGNLTASDKYGDNRINTIAGRTLAQLVVDSFNSSIYEEGSEGKMSLIFGSYEPAVAFAALAQLTTLNANFYGRPVPGASLVFELYSYQNESNVEYPSDTDLFVRFLLRNNTDSSVGFTSYSLFGYGPSQISVPYIEFRQQLAEFTVSSTDDWCEICKSTTVFCSASDSDSDSDSDSASQKRLSPGAAGVIGACVTLVTVALFVAALACISGVRTQRKQPSGMGGFKGNNKLASDTDVTFKAPFGGAIETTERMEDDGSSGATVRGHERQGSWEMGQQRKETESENAHKTSSAFEHREEDDMHVNPFEDPVKPHETV